MISFARHGAFTIDRPRRTARRASVFLHFIKACRAKSVGLSSLHQSVPREERRFFVISSKRAVIHRTPTTRCTRRARRPVAPHPKAPPLGGSCREATEGGRTCRNYGTRMKRRERRSPSRLLAARRVGVPYGEEKPRPTEREPCLTERKSRALQSKPSAGTQWQIGIFSHERTAGITKNAIPAVFYLRI